MCRKRFSLIELLVVVAIIGILSSLLLPSLSKARLKAQRAVCLANLKNMFPAVVMYSDNNTDYIPWSQRRAGNVDPHVWWRRQILTYMGDYPINSTNWNDLYIDELGEGVFACPNVNNGITTYNKGGYGWNLKYLGWGMTSSWAAGAPKKISKSVAPDETNAAGDCSDDDSLPSWEQNMFMAPSLRGLTGIGTRHSTGINRLWLDGHASGSSTSATFAGKDGDEDYFYKLEK